MAEGGGWRPVGPNIPDYRQRTGGIGFGRGFQLGEGAQPDIPSNIPIPTFDPRDFPLTTPEQLAQQQPPLPAGSEQALQESQILQRMEEHRQVERAPQVPGMIVFPPPPPPRRQPEFPPPLPPIFTGDGGGPTRPQVPRLPQLPQLPELPIPFGPVSLGPLGHRLYRPPASAGACCARSVVVQPRVIFYG